MPNCHVHGFEFWAAHWSGQQRLVTSIPQNQIFLWRWNYFWLRFLWWALNRARGLNFILIKMESINPCHHCLILIRTDRSDVHKWFLAQYSYTKAKCRGHIHFLVSLSRIWKPSCWSWNNTVQAKIIQFDLAILIGKHSGISKRTKPRRVTTA